MLRQPPFLRQSQQRGKGGKYLICKVGDWAGRGLPKLRARLGREEPLAVKETPLPLEALLPCPLSWQAGRQTGAALSHICRIQSRAGGGAAEAGSHPREGGQGQGSRPGGSPELLFAEMMVSRIDGWQQTGRGGRTDAWVGPPPPRLSPTPP